VSESIGSTIELINHWYIEPLMGTYSDVGTHAVSHRSLHFLLLFIWVCRTVHQVAAQFADILYGVGCRSRNLRPERSVGELPAEHNRTSGVDAGVVQRPCAELW